MAVNRRVRTLLASFVLFLAFCIALGYSDLTAAPPESSTAETPGAEKTTAVAKVEASKVDLTKILAGDAPATLDELKELERVVTDLLPSLMKATIAVQVGASQGSGVIIDKEGHVLTAAHVVGEPGKAVIFIMPDGKRLRGKTLGANHDIDAGLMQITDKADLPVVEWGDSAKLKSGQWCLSLGHPGGYQRGRNPVVRFGRIFTSRKTLIASDCTIMPGDSGGPLFDLAGKVVGIHSRIGGPLTANIHVPISAYRDGWEKMLAGESWGRDSDGGGPYLGVIGDLETKDKAKLAQVNAGTPADKAGLKAGDVILKFRDTDVKSFDQLGELVRKEKVGANVPLKIQRGDETLDLKIRLASRPAG